MRERVAILRPLRWLAHLPLAILPFLAAAIEGPRLERVLQHRVEGALAAAGAGWAKVTADGRDLEIRGLAPDRAAAETARRVAAGVYGVRRVDMRTGTALP